MRQFPVTIHRKYTIGDTIAFSVSEAEFPSALYNLSFVVCSTPVTSFAATANGDGIAHDIVITPEQSSTIKPGQQQCALIFTAIADGARTTYATKLMVFVPDPTQPITQTWAMTTLTALEGAIQTLSGGTNFQTTVNGQLYTKKDLKSLMDVRDKLRVEVNRELTELGRRKTSKTIRTRFVD